MTRFAIVLNLDAIFRARCPTCARLVSLNMPWARAGEAERYVLRKHRREPNEPAICPSSGAPAAPRWNA